MKNLFNIFLLAVLVLSSACFPASVHAQGRRADKDTKEWRYEIECAGIGNEGTYLIKVWSYSKKSGVASEQAKKNAVHGVIFKGFGGGQGCTSQRPLASNPSVEFEKEDFFKSFFEDGGKFMKYVTLTNSIPEDVVKIGKEYKVGVVVTVQKDFLRKDLEAAGIIKGLTSGF